MSKACRHCGSPQRFNPCWWGIRHKTYNPESYDPPCIDEMYAEGCREQERRQWRATRIFGFSVCAALILMLAMCGYVRAEELIEPTPEEYADIQKWISSTCCWTNHCCFKVKPSAFTAIPSVPFMDEWRVNETGQILKRTGWSRDGQTWRCTCDYVDGKWVAHPRANTRCIFPAQSGS